MSRMKALENSRNYELNWIDVLNNRFKHLFCELTSFKNLVLSALVALYWFDGLGPWPFVCLAASILGLKEFKEIVSAFRGK